MIEIAINWGESTVVIPGPPEGWEVLHVQTGAFVEARRRRGGGAVIADIGYRWPYYRPGVAVHHGFWSDRPRAVWPSISSDTLQHLATRYGLIEVLSAGFREFDIVWPTREEDTVEPDPIDQPDDDLHLLRLFTDGGPQFELECIGHDYRLCAAHRAFGDGESVTLNDNPSFPIPVVFVADDDDLSPDEGQEVGVWGDLGPWVWEDWRTSSAARIAKIKGGAS